MTLYDAVNFDSVCGNSNVTKKKKRLQFIFK
jgi:hypothetical protein